MFRSSLKSALLASTIIVWTPWVAKAQAVDPANPSAPIALPPVQVQTSAPRVVEDTKGFTSRRDETATKTDTPLGEVPKSISVINREQLDSRQVQTLGEAISCTAGVQSEPYGAATHVDFFSIRGFSTNDTGTPSNRAYCSVAFCR